MTVICSALNLGAFLGLSDVLISYESEPPRKEITRPLRRDPVAIAGNVALAGMTQKAFVLGERTLVLWAGSEVVARTICDEIAKASDGGQNHVEILKLIDDMGLSESEAKSAAIIYHYLDDERRIHRIYHFGIVSPTADFELIHAGSGSWDFLEDTAVHMPPANSAPLALSQSWLMRVLATLMNELLSDAPARFAYGGWFELVTIAEEGFRKLNIGVAIWFYRDETLELNRIVYGNYEGADLMVTDIDMDTKSPRIRHHQIRANPLSLAVDLEPEDVKGADELDLLCHAVIQPDGRLGMMITNTPKEHLHLKVDFPKIELELSETTANMLLDLGEGSMATARVLKPSAAF